MPTDCPSPPQADAAIGKAETAGPHAGSEQAELQGLMAELQEAVSGASAPEDAAQFFALRVFRHLLEVSASAAAAASPPPGAKLAPNFYATCLMRLMEVGATKVFGHCSLCLSVVSSPTAGLRLPEPF